MRQAHQVDGARATLEERLQGGFSAFAGIVPQERIACAEWKKTHGHAFGGRGAGAKNSVQDFVAGAIAAYREKSTVALGISLAREAHGCAWSIGCGLVNLQTAIAQPRQCGSG
jgi:hypothetical protein